jgi:two-component system chemotaxis sensor kinase CheA
MHVIVEKVKGLATARLQEIEREIQELNDLRNTFVEEAKSILIDLDPLLTALDEGSASQEDINLIYRKVHTLKGSAGSLPNSSSLVRLAHSLETVLTGMKEGKVERSPDLVTAMLQALELFNACVSALESGVDLPNTSELQSKLNLFAGQQPAVATKAASSAELNPKPDKPQRKAESTEDGVMVQNERLEILKDLAGELVAFKNTYDVFLKQHGDEMGVHLRELMEMARTLFKITDNLQAEVLNIQQVSFGKTFSKFPRVVRQVAGELGKQIKLTVHGAQMTVDRTVSRALSDALLHAVRNSCDHGVEKPEQRNRSGKSPIGEIAIKGSQSADTITVEVIDDGAGLNRDRILSKAVERQIISPERAKDMPDAEVWDLLFQPNFSTAEKVSDISGRGVGMDVVRTAALKLGGNAWFSTVPGKETRLTMQFPVPKSLVVEASVVAKFGDHIFIVPFNTISEIRYVDEAEMTFVQPHWTIQNRGVTIPVGSYLFMVDDPAVSRVQRESGSFKRSGLLAILQHRGRSVGVYLDQVIDQMEAVIRPFDDVIGRISGFRGVSRLPNDEVGYVLSAEDAIRNVYEVTRGSQVS